MMIPGMVYDRNLSHRAIAVYCYLCDRAKGMGLGRALLEHAEAGAREAGYRRIYLETHSVLQAAVRLYEKTGYREIPRPAWIVHSAMDRFFTKEL